MIDSSCKIVGNSDRETLFVRQPRDGQILSRMVIQVIHIPDDYPIIYLDKPPAEETARSGPAHNQPKMRCDKSLGGERKGLTLV